MEKINGRKLSLIFIFILILLVIALLVGKFTYSYLGPTISDDLETQGEVTASGDTLIFTKGNNLSLSATTDNFTTGGTNLTSTTNPKVKLVASTKTNQADATYYVGVLIKNNTYVYTTSGKTPELILTIKDEKGNNVTSGVDGLTYVTSGGVSGFDVTSKKGLFNIKTDYPISTTSSSAGTTHTWTFTLTFVNLGTDQSDNENASMNVDIYLQKEEYKLLLNEYVISLYTGTQGENGLYYHTSTLANGAGDNSYRYAGPSDTTNNFVCFGSDAATCPTDNLYRIIGVFEDKVKLIKYDYATSVLLGTDGDYSGSGTPSSKYYKGSLSSVNTYYWNYKAASKQSNVWSTSLLSKTNLNTNFINNIGSSWANKIATTTWQVGGNTNANIRDAVPAVAYTNEIKSPAENIAYDAKIGLMYASDYGFGAVPEAWTVTLFDYEGVDGLIITTQNWMHMGYDEWTVSRFSEDDGVAFFVHDYGSVSISDVDYKRGVRPVFNLESTVVYVSGSGTQSDPIRIN